MKILVFSDSHGYYERILPIIRKHPDAQVVIHCGDMYQDAVNLENLLNDKYKFYYVIGNNDYINGAKELSLEFENKKIFVTHGHLYGVKSGLDSIRKKIKGGYDLAIFGHTHTPLTEYYLNGTILNPGAMCYSSKSTYAIVTIEKNTIKTEILNANQ